MHTLKTVPFRQSPVRAFCAIILLTLCSAARAQTPSPHPDAVTPGDKWQITVSPYLWLSGTSGDLNIAGHQIAMHQSFADILSNMQAGVTGMAEVRRKRIGLITDLVYLKEGSQKGTVLPGPQQESAEVRVTNTTLMLSEELAWRVYSRKRFTTDALGGFRFYHLGVTSRFNAGTQLEHSASASSDWADAIAGARLRAAVTPKLGVFLLGDAGGGGSSPAWSLAYGAGYRVTHRITAHFGYRRLYFNHQDRSHVSMEATQQGLLAGAAIRLR